MFHLAAFAESLDPAGALVNVAGVNDPELLVSGDDVRVPVKLPYYLGGAALISATTPIQAQYQSPSLRQIANIDVAPCASGLVFDDPAEVQMQPYNPISLAGDEALNFKVNTDPGSAELHYGLAWLGDGPQQPVSGNFFALRVTASVTCVANQWVAGELTFPTDLPVGNYKVVGMHVFGTGLIAGRLNFRGDSFNPGVPAATTIFGKTHDVFRMGKMGLFGTFHTNTPPQIELLGAAATVATTIILDLEASN